MNKRIFIMLTGMILLSCCRIFGQGMVSVNNFTGAANINIPLFNVTSGSLTAPIGVSYSGGGLRVRDIEGSAGMAWNLNVGGGIYRSVRGLPDDNRISISAGARVGWLYNTSSTKIGNFSIANNGAADCTKEATDLSYIGSNFNDLSDTEPDVYTVSAPGLSCRLYIDSAHHFQMAPYRDYKLATDTDFIGRIIKFTITNDKGTVYVFSDLEKTDKTITGTPTYYKRDFDLYKGEIIYFSAWRLHSMTDINGNGIVFNYTSAKTQRSTPFALALGGSSTATSQYTDSEELTFQSPSRVSVCHGTDTTQVISCNYFAYGRTGQLIDAVTGYGKTVYFVYGDYRNSVSGDYRRQFLKQIDLGDRQLTFSYHGVNDASYHVSLPDSSSKKIDYWGYYTGSSNTSLIPQVYVNPSNSSYERYRNIYPTTNIGSYSVLISGADRHAVLDSAMIGTIDTVKYSRGGYTKIYYELNDYYDPTAGENIHGGGLRVKQIRDYTGTDTTKASVRNYSYLVPGTSTSSGKPIALPMFEFTTPYTSSGTTQSKWEHSTVRSEDDLSPEDKTIMYANVTVSQPGAGKTVYSYATPASVWDSGSADWSPTTVHVARESCTTLSFATSDINTYGFPNNPNYDFERGLPTKTTSYDDNGKKASETTYEYIRTAAPTVITGFKLDTNLNVVNYAKYRINVNTDELTAKVTNRVYNLNDTTSKVDRTHYYYASANHKLLTKQQATGSDGAVHITNFKYVKDYTTANGGSDSVNLAMFHLQQLNCNLPIETWQQVQRDSLRTVGASLTKFKTFTISGNNLYLPAHKLSFVSGGGVTNFTPSTITAAVFSKDSRYIVTENDVFYDDRGSLQTMNDDNRHTNTVLTDHLAMQPAAVFANANVNEIGFNNYDTSASNAGFTLDGTVTSDGRTGKGLSLASSNAPNRTFSKSPRAANYIFSVWIKATTGSTMTVTLTSGATSHNYTFSYAGNGQYTYYQKKVPLTGMSSTFTMSYQPGNSVITDDVVVYPENAQAGTTAYDTVSRQKIVETTTNGKAAYYTYDRFRRQLAVFDNDHNMVKRLSYVNRNGADPVDLGAVTVGIVPSDKTVAFYVNIPMSENTDGMRFRWNFGDDTTHVITMSSSIVHTYPGYATYSYTVTISSPYYPDKTISGTVTTSAIPDPGSYPIISASSLDNGTGTITAVSFSIGGVLKYSFSQQQLESGSVYVAPGNYAVSVNVSGQQYNESLGTGYKRALMTISTGDESCVAFSGKPFHQLYSFSVDLTHSGITSINFSLDTYDCIPVP